MTNSKWAPCWSTFRRRSRAGWHWQTLRHAAALLLSPKKQSGSWACCHSRCGRSRGRDGGLAASRSKIEGSNLASSNLGSERGRARAGEMNEMDGLVAASYVGRVGRGWAGPWGGFLAGPTWLSRKSGFLLGRLKAGINQRPSRPQPFAVAAATTCRGRERWATQALRQGRSAERLVAASGISASPWRLLIGPTDGGMQWNASGQGVCR